MRLDYFYNTEGENFRFYQIPALLLEEEIPYWDFSQKSPNRDKPEAGFVVSQLTG